MADKGIYHDDEISLYVLYLEAITLHGYSDEEALVANPIDCVVHWYIGDTAHHQSINLRIDRRKVDIKYCVFVTVKNRKATEKDLNVCVSITGINQAHLGVHFLSLNDLAQSEAFAEHTFDLHTQDGPYATINVHGASQVRWTEIAQHLPQSDAVVEFVSPEEDSQSRHIWAFIAPEAAVGDSRGNRAWELPSVYMMDEPGPTPFQHGGGHQLDEQAQHDTAYGGTPATGTGTASGMDKQNNFLRADPTTPTHDGYAAPAAYNYGAAADATTTPRISTILEQQQQQQQHELELLLAQEQQQQQQLEAEELERLRQEEEKRRREPEVFAHEDRQEQQVDERREVDEQGTATANDQEVDEREAPNYNRGEAAAEEEKERRTSTGTVAARRSSQETKRLFPRRSKNSLSSSSSASKKKVLPPRESIRRSKSVSSGSIPDDFVARSTPREELDDSVSPSSRNAHQQSRKSQKNDEDDEEEKEKELGDGIHLELDAYISTLQAGKMLTAVTAKNYRREIHVSISLDRRVLIIGLHPKDRRIAFTDIGPRVLRGREAEVNDEENNSIHLTDECRTLCVDEDNITFEFPDMVHADTFGAALERLVLEAGGARDALVAAAQQRRLSSRNRASAMRNRASMGITAAETTAERRRLSSHQKVHHEAESANSGTENTASPMLVHDPKPDHEGDQRQLQHKGAGRISSGRREGSKSSEETKNARGTASSKQRSSGTTSASKSPRTPRRKRAGLRSSKRTSGRSSSTKQNLKELERIKEAARQEDLRRRHELKMRELKRRERELDKREIEIRRAKENATEETRQTMEIERAKTLALISHRLGTGTTGGGSPFPLGGGPTSSIPLDGDPLFNPQNATRIEEQADGTHARGLPISRDRASGPRTKDLSLNDVDASGLWMHHSEAAQGAMRGSVSARMQALRGLAVSRDSERTQVSATTTANWDHVINQPNNGGKVSKAQRGGGGGGHMHGTNIARGRSGDQRQQQQQQEQRSDEPRSGDDDLRSGDDEEQLREESLATSGDENRWEWDDEVREIRRTLSTDRDRRRASSDAFGGGSRRGSRKESKSSSQPPAERGQYGERRKRSSTQHEEYDDNPQAYQYGERSQALYERQQQPLGNAINAGMGHKKAASSFVRDGGKTRRNEKYREKENFISSNQDQGDYEQPTIRELIVTQESSTPRFYGRNNNNYNREKEDLSATTTHEYNKMRLDKTPESYSHHRAYHSYPFDERNNNTLERDYYDESGVSRSHDPVHMYNSRHISAGTSSHRQSSVVGYRNESSGHGRRNLDTRTPRRLDSESSWGERESSVVAQRRPRDDKGTRAKGEVGEPLLSSNGRNPVMSGRAHSEEKGHGRGDGLLLVPAAAAAAAAHATPRGDLMSSRSSNGTNLGGDSKVHFFRVLTNAIGVRESPHYDGRRTGDVLTRGTVCFVDAIHANHSDGRFYLHLADDQGWIFDDSRIDPSDPSVEIITGTGAIIPPLYDHVLGYKPPVPVLSQVSRMLQHHHEASLGMGTGRTGTHAPSSQYSQSYPSTLGHQPQHQPLALPPPTIMSMIDSARRHRSPLQMMNEFLPPTQHAAGSTPNPAMTRSWETSPRTDDLSVDLQALRSNYGIQPTINGMSGPSLQSGMGTGNKGMSMAPHMSGTTSMSATSGHLSHRTPNPGGTGFKPFLYASSPNPGLLSSPLTPPGTELLREGLGNGSSKANKPREPKDTHYGFT